MKVETVFCRYEMKYLITAVQKAALLDAMRGRMCADEYGRSTICNLYFDTDDYLLARRSIERPLYKEKLRLRSYGTAKADGVLYAEIKKKCCGVVYKRRIALPCAGEADFDAGRFLQNTQIAREIGYFFREYPTIAPRVYLSYEREAFFGKEDTGFRVTFDDRILARTDALSLSDKQYGLPLLPPGKVLMEVKCAGALPLWMAELLSREKIYKTSFSKYGTAYALFISEGEQHA